MTRLSNEQGRALLATKENKPVKQYQGSNNGKAPPLPEVRITSLKLAQNTYSPVKQDILNMITKHISFWNEQMNLIKTHDDWCFVMCQIREWRTTERKFKELDV